MTTELAGIAAVIIVITCLLARYYLFIWRKEIRDWKRTLASCQADMAWAANEFSTRQDRLDIAYRRLATERFEREWRKLRIRDFKVDGLGKQGVERLESDGYSRIADVDRGVPTIPRLRGDALFNLLSLKDSLRDEYWEEHWTAIPGAHLLPEETNVATTALALLDSDDEFQEQIAAQERALPQEHRAWKKVHRRALLRCLAGQKPVHIREHVSTARNQSNVDETRETARALKADLESKDAKRAESSLTDLYAESRTQVIELLLDRFHPGKVHGLKSDDLVERIEATPLHPHFKEISLRRYQAFGAKFALAQERVLLGDEMGLGKTIEALAVATHLKRERKRLNAIVVAPAPVCAQWRHEIERLTSLTVDIANPREVSEKMMKFDVLIISLGALSRASCKLPPQVDLAVIDECHYVKNPAANRSHQAQRIVKWADYAMLMSGTPIENRPSEMIALIAMLQPSLGRRLADSHDAGTLGPLRFRKAIAPVYLRRKQEDVLPELPEMIEEDEWVDLTSTDHGAYMDALMGGTYHDALRAATIGRGDGQSGKMQRLDELIVNYQETNEKVLVFSFYLDIVRTVQGTCGTRYVITGALSSNERQRTVEEFTNEPGHAILVSQINAGGVGLNLQAASVVVIMEPQTKPTTEWQAIARTRRIGQLRRVHVHRLIAEDTYDERLRTLLGSKIKDIMAYADRSALKEAAQEAVNPESLKGLLEQAFEEERRSKLGSLPTEPAKHRDAENLMNP